MIYFCQKLLVSDGLLESCSIIRQQTREAIYFVGVCFYSR